MMEELVWLASLSMINSTSITFTTCIIYFTPTYPFPLTLINFIKLLPPEQMLNYLPMPDLYLSVFNHKWTLPPLSNIRKLNSKKKDLIQELPLYVIVPFSPFYFTLIDFYPSPRRTPCI